MPTVEELEIAYRDQISAAANAGTASLNKMADAMDRTGTSADTVDTKITRTGKSAVGYVNSLDSVTKSANALSKAQQDLSTAQDKLSKGVADGSVTQDQATRALQAQQDKVAALTARHAEFAAAAAKSGDATKGLGDEVGAANPKLEEHSGLMTKVAGAFGVSSYQVTYATDELHKFVDQVVSGGDVVGRRDRCHAGDAGERQRQRSDQPDR